MRLHQLLEGNDIKSNMPTFDSTLSSFILLPNSGSSTVATSQKNDVNDSFIVAPGNMQYAKIIYLDMQTKKSFSLRNLMIFMIVLKWWQSSRFGNSGQFWKFWTSEKKNIHCKNKQTHQMVFWSFSLMEI